jgi:hypothetical protein
MRHVLVAALALATFFALTTTAAGHEFDHFTPEAVAPTVPGTTAISGGPGATWEFVATIPTGNPHTDLDYFTQRGEIYASVGTLAAGGNDAGQNIVQLTHNGTPTSHPHYVSGHGSADCISDPSAATGLQHDVEATPKGHAILNTAYPFSVKKDAQLLVDATDNPGRCHDNGTAGFGAPQGGLELIDITRIDMPVEIGLTSHIGESHTVNVDPKRPHIAYSVTSDFVTVSCNNDDTSCKRNDEDTDPNTSQGLNLDGFEIVDMSSCMNFPVGTTLEQKRARCQPKVYRYRYPSALMGVGHTHDTYAGCHELEIYPDDKLTCASVSATMHFDMSGAFDANGKPRGTPLPCRRRPSTSLAAWATDAMVTDCVVGKNNQDLRIEGWKAIGSPSLAGVRFLGAVFHQGRVGNTPPAYDATQDVEISHESELSASRRLILTTDERGGGVLPPGAACATSPLDNTSGNGGIHAYRVSALRAKTPSGPDAAAATTAWQAYAQKPGGGKAIYRAPIRTQPQVNLCTAHVFHQIPGQNRIFMGWYSQGTQVVDFIEHRDGTVEFKEAGFFIPILPNANEWVSAVFKVKQNANGTYTYWGATGDFNLGTAGRSAIDIYKVTLPAPPKPFGQDPEEGCPAQNDEDGDGLIDSRELALFTLLGVADSDFDGIKDGNDDANGNGRHDEDEDDDDGCPDRDSDRDGTDDEDEDD